MAVNTSIRKLLPGYKSTEFGGLVVFVILVISNQIWGDLTLINGLVSVSDPSLKDLLDTVRTQGQTSKESLELILYALMSYFAKRGYLKGKEIETKKTSKVIPHE